MKKDINDSDDKNEILDNIIKEQGLEESLKERMDLSEYGDCPVCGETLYELKVRPKIEKGQKTLEGEDAVEPKVLKRCHICGDDECQYYDENGYAVHPEYMGEAFGEGDWMCYGCYENPIGGVTLINASGTRYFTAYEGLLTDNEEGDGDISKEESAALEDLAKSIQYVRTDGWRGYYDSKAPKDWKTLASGWHSTCEDTEMSEYIVSLGYKRKKAFPIIRVVLQTSNVCSAAVDVYVPKDADTTELEADMPPTWAENYNIGPPEVVS